MPLAEVGWHWMSPVDKLLVACLLHATHPEMELKWRVVKREEELHSPASKNRTIPSNVFACRGLLVEQAAWQRQGKCTFAR